jgi:predicted DNA-binding transcriptional regulator AlpA
MNRKPKHRDPPPPHALTPQEVIRKSVSHVYFGLRPTQLDAAIESGKIPTPIKLGKRARGFFGKQILDWQAQKLAEATKRD